MVLVVLVGYGGVGRGWWGVEFRWGRRVPGCQ